LIISDLLGALNEEKMELSESPIKPSQVASLLTLVDKGVISIRVAKEEVLPELIKMGKEPEEVVKEKGLVQISDEGALTEVIKKVLANNEKAVKQYKEGNEKQKQKAVKFLIGQVMKETRGKANPKLLNELIPKVLEQV